jgi:hypothetical protein
MFDLLRVKIKLSIFPTGKFIHRYPSYSPDFTTLREDPINKKKYAFLKEFLCNHFPENFTFDDSKLHIVVSAVYPPSLSVQYVMERDGAAILNKLQGQRLSKWDNHVAIFAPVKWNVNDSSVENFEPAISLHQGPEVRFCELRKKFFSEQKSQPRAVAHQFSDLLQNSFIVGNNHQEIDHFQFLITNMQLFKDNGFDTLFVEFLPYEIQVMLDNYFRSASSDMLPCLESYIHNRWPPQPRLIDSYHCADNFVQLIKTAKSCGIRVVGLENRCTIEHDRSDKGVKRQPTRSDDISYSAYQIIQKEVNEGRCKKWIAHVGTAHVDTFEGIPGISQLTGANALYILDDTATAIPKCAVNTNFTYDGYKFAPQFLLRAKPGTDLNMSVLCPKINQPKNGNPEEEESLCSIM